MKKSNFIFTVIFIWIVISFCSCSESETEMKQEKVFPTSFELIKDQELNQAGIFTPSTVSIEGDKAVIGFLPSTRIYSILLTDEVSRSCVDFLQKTIKEKKPLKVFTLQNSNEICKIEQLSEEEEKKHVLSTSPSRKSRTTLKRYVTTSEELYLIELICRPSINFDYTGDGCFARAHKMRQIINDLGYECDKIFIFGKYDGYRHATLGVYNYTGSCCSYSTYHVAPVIYYGNAESHSTIVLAPLMTSTNLWPSECMESMCFPYVDYRDLIESGYDMTCIESGDVYYLDTQNPDPRGARYYDDDYSNTDYILNLCEGRTDCGPL